MAAKSIAIIIATGAWHLPIHYSPLEIALESRGFQVSTPTLPTMSVLNVSTYDPNNPIFDIAQPAEGWPNGYEDSNRTRQEIELASNHGYEVMLVAHSYGGWVATQAALPELQRDVRRRRGKRGGVVGIFYISGLILPEGHSINSYFSPQGDETPPPPFSMLHKHGRKGLVTAVNTLKYFFNGVPPLYADFYAKKLRAQPVITDRLTNPSYNDLPCAYLFTEQDQAIIPLLQGLMVKNIQNRDTPLINYTCNAGHDPWLNKATEVASYIEDFAYKLASMNLINTQ